MKIGRLDVKMFKIKNRRGFAAVCKDCLTEGQSREEAFARMVKAITRLEKKIRKK